MIEGLILSIQFLTRIPVNIPIDFNKKNAARSTLYFPLIGMIIGGISSIVYFALFFLDRDIASFAAVISIIFITGGLHLDGLSDTCDGFFSAREKDRVLEIMKDSRAGTFGVIAIVLDILLKYILLSKLDKNIAYVLMISCANARLIASMLMSFTKCARPLGLADLFSGSGTKKYFYVSLVIFIIFIVCIFGVKYLIPLVAAFLASLLIILKSYNTIDGLTGDVYGASIEICEIVSIATFWMVNIWM